VEALRKLHDQGMLIFIATGRTKSGILRVTPEEVPLSGFVAASGMSIYNLSGSIMKRLSVTVLTGHWLKKFLLPQENVKFIMKHSLLKAAAEHCSRIRNTV